MEKIPKFRLTKAERRVYGPDCSEVVMQIAELVHEYEQMIFDSANDEDGSELTKEEILDYMLEVGLFDSMEGLEDLAGSFTEHITRTGNEILARKRKAGVKRAKEALAQESAIGPSNELVEVEGIGVVGVKSGRLSSRDRRKKQKLLKVAKRHAEKVSDKAVMRASLQEKMMKAASAIIAKVGTHHPILNEFLTHLSTASLVERVLSESQELKDSSPDMQGFDLESQVALSIEEQQDYSIDSIKKLYVGRDQTGLERDVASILEFHRSFACIFLVVRNFQLQAEQRQDFIDQARARQAADDLYENMKWKLAGDLAVGSGGFSSSGGPVRTMSFEKDPNCSVCRVKCHAVFQVGGAEVPIVFGVSRLTSELVMPSNWCYGYRSIFKAYGVEGVYDEIRGKVMHSLDNILDVDEEVDSPYGEWWLDCGREECEPEVVEELVDEKEVGSERIKGLRQSVRGVSHKKAMRAFERLGLTFKVGSIDFKVTGTHSETGEACSGIFPGNHGAGRESANTVAAINCLRRKFGISREAFLRACS